MPTSRFRPAAIAPRPASCYDAVVNSPVPDCRIAICCNDQGINAIHFLPQQTPLQRPSPDSPRHNLINQALSALEHYFNRPQTRCLLPLAATGTVFQHRVWQAISAIPCGETRSYGQLARELNSSARAIGGACRANPVPLLIPCHRVIAANGQQGGFLGQNNSATTASEIKRWLLHHEAETARPCSSMLIPA